MTLTKFLPALLLVSYAVASPVTFTAGETKIDDNYRIPNIYKDISYNISLTVPSESLTTADKNAFSGSVSIKFTPTVDTNVIKLHSSHDYITLKTINLNNRVQDDYVVDNTTDVLSLSIGSELGANIEYVLNITFDGILGDDMAGFYKSFYQADRETRYLATTHFESTRARRAFPCFDEPAIKGTFTLSLTIPETFEAFSNTPQAANSTVTDGMKTVSFETTPVMSTYLVAFIVSDFRCTQGEDAEDAGKVPTRVCSRPGTAASRAFALDFAPKVIRVLNDFTQIKYGDSMEKMDLMAIPDFAAGAMENWGLVTYRETLLLIDEGESSNSNKQRVAADIAHEFSHQWFGDLVTCDWWSELYLNEGFATYFEYHATSQVFTGWEMQKQFIPDVVHRALAYDASLSSKALKSNVSTPAEIEARFDDISYEKGGSVLRMVQHIVGLDNFKAGLTQYLMAESFQTGTSEILWDNFNQTYSNLPEGTVLADVMTNWIEQPGYPLVTVTKVNDSIVLKQERFVVPSNTTVDGSWYVPISYTTSKDETKFQETSPRVWLSPSDINITIDLPEDASWVVLNNQQTGFYRVAYSADLMGPLAEALKGDNFSGIIDLNRAQIVDDIFNIAKLGTVGYETVFELIAFLENDTSYYSWKAAFSGFDFLLIRVGQESDLGKAIIGQILRLAGKLLDSVPLNTTNADDQIYTLSQVQALTWACKLGNEDCVSVTAKLFEEYRNTSRRIDPNLRTVAYCNGLRYSNDSEDWDFLWNEYLATQFATEKTLLLPSLGCTKDADLLKGFLEKSIANNSDIKPQDASTAYTSVYTNNPEGIDVAFDFLIENHEAITEKYKTTDPGSLLKNIAERFTTAGQVQKLQDFVDSDNIPEELKSPSQQALETAQANLKWLDTHRDELNNVYGIKHGNSGTLTKTSAVAVLLGLLLAVLL